MKPQVVISTGIIFETVLCCSVTIYYLSIDQCFLDNQFVSGTNYTGFSWYSKYGGLNSGLKYISHLKEKNVLIFNTSLTPLYLNTELSSFYVYSTPFMSLSPLKEQNTLNKEKLYRLVGNYCTVRLNFILFWVVLTLSLYVVWLLYCVVTCNCQYNVQYCLQSCVFVTFFVHFFCFGRVCLVVYGVFLLLFFAVFVLFWSFLSCITWYNMVAHTPTY